MSFPLSLIVYDKKGRTAIIYTVLPLLNNKHLAIFLLYPRKYELCFLHHLLFLL